MPIYEYVCETCGEDFEVMQKFSDPPLTRHTCAPKSKVRRKLSLTAFQLKGGGWYKEGYSGIGGSPSNGASGSNGSSAKEKSDDKGSKGDSGSSSSSGSTAKSDSKSSGGSAKSDSKPSGSSPASA